MLDVEMVEIITTEMDMTFDSVVYYTDSKIVLGYIGN